MKVSQTVSAAPEVFASGTIHSHTAPSRSSASPVPSGRASAAASRDGGGTGPRPTPCRPLSWKGGKLLRPAGTRCPVQGLLSCPHPRPAAVSGLAVPRSWARCTVLHLARACIGGASFETHAFTFPSPPAPNGAEHALPQGPPQPPRDPAPPARPGAHSPPPRCGPARAGRAAAPAPGGRGSPRRPSPPRRCLRRVPGRFESAPPPALPWVLAWGFPLRTRLGSPGSRPRPGHPSPPPPHPPRVSCLGHRWQPPPVRPSSAGMEWARCRGLSRLGAEVSAADGQPGAGAPGAPRDGAGQRAERQPRPGAAGVSRVAGWLRPPPAPPWGRRWRARPNRGAARRERGRGQPWHRPNEALSALTWSGVGPGSRRGRGHGETGRERGGTEKSGGGSRGRQGYSAATEALPGTGVPSATLSAPSSVL